MSEAAKFPKRKLTAEQKRVWKNSDAYKAGVAKATARKVASMRKIAASTKSAPADAVAAKLWLQEHAA